MLLILTSYRFLLLTVKYPHPESLVPLFELPRKLVHRVQSKPQMLIVHLFSFPNSERMCRPRSILKLALIDTTLRQLLDLLCRDILGRRSHLRNEGGPDLFLGLLG